MLLQGRAHFGEHEHHFFEFLLLEEADHCVDLWSDACSSLLSREQTDLTEEVASFEGSDETVSLSYRVFDVYFALA
jgi:hypothetical protein